MLREFMQMTVTIAVLFYVSTFLIIGHFWYVDYVNAVGKENIDDTGLIKEGHFVDPETVNTTFPIPRNADWWTVGEILNLAPLWEFYYWGGIYFLVVFSYRFFADIYGMIRYRDMPHGFLSHPFNFLIALGGIFFAYLMWCSVSMFNEMVHFGLLVYPLIFIFSLLAILTF